VREGDGALEPTDNCSSKLGQGNIRRHQIIPASWWTGGCSWAQAAIPQQDSARTQWQTRRAQLRHST
jgi:hypothetical protein